MQNIDIDDIRYKSLELAQDTYNDVFAPLVDLLKENKITVSIVDKQNLNNINNWNETIQSHFFIILAKNIYSYLSSDNDANLDVKIKCFKSALSFFNANTLVDIIKLSDNYIKEKGGKNDFIDVKIEEIKKKIKRVEISSTGIYDINGSNYIIISKLKREMKKLVASKDNQFVELDYQFFKSFLAQLAKNISKHSLDLLNSLNVEELDLHHVDENIQSLDENIQSLDDYFQDAFLKIKTENKSNEDQEQKNDIKDIDVKNSNIKNTTNDTNHLKIKI